MNNLLNQGRFVSIMQKFFAKNEERIAKERRMRRPAKKIKRTCE